MSPFNPALGGVGYDHGSSRPGNNFDLRPTFGLSGNHYRYGSGGFPVSGYGQTGSHGYPLGYTYPFGFNGGTSAPVFGYSRQPFGFTPNNGATFATRTGCGISMPTFGHTSANPFGFTPINGGTAMPAFGQNSATPFGFTPGNGGTYMPAFGQNSATLGSAPANGVTSLPTFGQSNTPFGFAPANAGALVPPFAFGRSTNSFGFTPSNTTTSVPAWQRSNPLGPVTTNGTTFASFPTNGAASVPATGAPLFSTLRQAALSSPICGSLSGSTSCLQTPSINPSSSPGFYLGCTNCVQPTLPSRTSSLYGTDPYLFGTQNHLPGSTTHFQTTTINASSSPGFGFGCTTSGHTTTQFGTIGNLNETSSCSDEIQSPFSGFQEHEIQSPFSGFQVKTPDTETVELEPGSQQSIRFMSISAMPAFRDKCHEELRWEVYQDKSYEELRWEDHQSNNAGGGGDPDSAQLNCFRNPVSRTGSSFQNAMPSSVPPNIFASCPPCFTFPTCTTPFTSNSLLNDSREGAYTSIAQLPSSGPTITFSHPNPSIIGASASEAFTSGPSFLNYTSSAPCASICSTSVTTPFTASVPCNIHPSISTLDDVSPSRCRAETPPAVPQMSAEGPKTTSVRYGISSIPVNHSANETQKLLLPPNCNRRGDGPMVTFCADAHETPTARMKDNSGISISGPSGKWTLKIDFENMSHIKHTSIHVYENGKVSVELFKPLVDGFMYQDKAGNPCATFAAAEHSLTTNSIDCNHTSEKEVSSNVYGLMPKLKHSDYFTEPRVEELAIKESFEPGFCSHVKDFVVGHQLYGRIKFLGESDVRQLDVNSHIVFGNGEVILSMDENKKPPVGLGLNKPAEITLCNIKCVDKAGNQHINGPKVDEYKEKLMKKAAEQGAEFVSYDPVQGEWKFRVEHF